MELLKERMYKMKNEIKILLLESKKSPLSKEENSIKKSKKTRNEEGEMNKSDKGKEQS